MALEVTESDEATFSPYTAAEETSTKWKGREIKTSPMFEELPSVRSKISSFDKDQNRPIVQTFAQAPSQRGWNHESFPTPPTKPILTPVPDAETCLRFAIGFKNELLRWMQEDEQFVNKGLMTRADFLHIESILIMLVDEVKNYCNAAGLYSREVDWKEVLHPLNKLFQFWKNKWKQYSIAPNPYDYPLP